MLPFILTVQVITFLALGAYFFAEGDWHFGLAQLLLAVVQGVVYTA